MLSLMTADQGAGPRQIRDVNEDQTFPDALEEKSQDISMLICIRGYCKVASLPTPSPKDHRQTDRQTN